MGGALPDVTLELNLEFGKFGPSSGFKCKTC